MDVTNEGEKYIKRWKSATEEVEKVRRQLDRAERILMDAKEILATWMLPEDAKANELFCVWCGDSLITAKHENGVCSVELRTRGKSWDKVRAALDNIGL